MSINLCGILPKFLFMPVQLISGQLIKYAAAKKTQNSMFPYHSAFFYSATIFLRRCCLSSPPLFSSITFIHWEAFRNEPGYKP